jgi:predicted secreted protein
MEWTSIVAIYALVWVATAFLSLPFGVRTHEEMGLEKVPGQADSAPGNFRPAPVVLRATLVAALLTALYVANYVNGWVVAEDLNIFEGPPVEQY